MSVLSQKIQFSISTLFSSILPIDRTLSGATTPGKNGPANDGNEGRPGGHGNKVYLHFPHHYWSLTIRLFSAIPRTLIGEVLLLCRDAVSVFYCPSDWAKKVLFQTIQFSINTVFLFTQMSKQF